VAASGRLFGDAEFECRPGWSPFAIARKGHRYHGYLASRVVVDQTGTHPGPVEPPAPPPHP